MAKLRALIIGVSEHTSIPADNLPFCKNDIFAVKQAFIQGLKVDPSEIFLCGTMGTVTAAEVISALHHLSDISEEDDSILVYFSGHGTTVTDSHYLVLSDQLIKTQELIKYLDNINAKNKVLFLDCCLAGNFTVDGTAVFNIDESVDEFAGRGYAVLASCNAQQYSYGHPGKPISLYESLKSFTEAHTATKEKVIVETRVIITRMVTLAEQIISLYNEYLNGTKSESDFKDDMARITPELSKLYFAETDLDISPNDLKEWSQLCENLAGTIHDFSLYYGQNAFSKRTPENRKACMDMSIKRYYKELEKLRAIDSSL